MRADGRGAWGAPLLNGTEGPRWPRAGVLPEGRLPYARPARCRGMPGQAPAPAAECRRVACVPPTLHRRSVKDVTGMCTPSSDEVCPVGTTIAVPVAAARAKSSRLWTIIETSSLGDQRRCVPKRTMQAL